MKWLIIVLILLLLYCLIIYFAFLYTFSRKIKVNMEKYMRDGYADVLQDRKKHVLNYPMEEVFIESHDHLKFYGRYFHAEGHDKLIVMCHGWKSEWYIDFSQLAILLYLYFYSLYAVLLRTLLTMRFHIIYYLIFHISVMYLVQMYVRMQVFQIVS